MPTQVKRKKKSSPWAYLSIKYKLSFVIALLVVLVATLLYLLSVQSSTLLNTAYAQSSEYYTINSLQQHLIASDTLMQTFLTNVSSRSSYQEEWTALSATIAAELAALDTDLATASLEEYFLATALQTGYIPYAEACEALITMGLSGADTLDLYAQYEVTVGIAEHLQNTALLLQTESITVGQSTLATLRAEIDQTLSSFTAFAVFFVFLFIFLISELLQAIVVPILRLAEASIAVRDGNFDTPDVELKNRDELYTLAVSFNEMKGSVKALFYAMQRQTEMEQELHQRELESRETSALLAEAQMHQLRNQINPHFLFNTLNIISRTARSEQAKKSEKLILSLARLFRYGLKTDADEVPLQREMNIVEDYISIQASRFTERVALQWRISPEIDPEQLLVPTFLLQPIVENAVIHALEPKLEGGVIRICAKRQGDALFLSITDNGVGMSKDALASLLEAKTSKGHVSGIGVGNVRSRLTLLHPDASFQIQSRANLGTRVVMRIPHVFGGEGDAMGTDVQVISVQMAAGCATPATAAVQNAEQPHGNCHNLIDTACLDSQPKGGAPLVSSE